MLTKQMLMCRTVNAFISLYGFQERRTRDQYPGLLGSHTPARRETVQVGAGAEGKGHSEEALF